MCGRHVVSSAYCVSRIPLFLDKPDTLLRFLHSDSSGFLNATIGSEYVVTLLLASKSKAIESLEVDLEPKQ